MPHSDTGSTAYFVLDVSALSKGLGNIRKWLETENSDTNLVLWIPSYTIHELDYQKKGLSIAASNARESIRLIEKVVTRDNRNKSSCKVLIETPDEAGPKWKDCMRYKVRAPRIHEFPKSKRGSNPQSTMVPVTMSETEAFKLAESHSDTLPTGDDGSDERAQLPARYRFLLRPLIKKVHLDPQNWIFVTEDQTTRIWCESFRIPCINVSEADAILFHAHGTSSAETITTDFGKISINEAGKKSRRSKKNKKSSQPGIGLSAKPVNHVPQEVKLESFDTMEYAPRGKGDLWVP